MLRVYAWIGVGEMRVKNLTKAQQKALDYILVYARHTGRNCFTYNDLARHFKFLNVPINIETLTRRVRELVEKGILQRAETKYKGKKRVMFCLNNEIFERIYEIVPDMMIERKIVLGLNPAKLRYAHDMISNIEYWARLSKIRLDGVYYGGAWLHDTDNTLIIVISVYPADYDRALRSRDDLEDYYIEPIIDTITDAGFDRPDVTIHIVPVFYKGY